MVEKKEKKRIGRDRKLIIITDYEEAGNIKENNKEEEKNEKRYKRKRKEDIEVRKEIIE